MRGGINVQNEGFMFFGKFSNFNRLPFFTHSSSSTQAIAPLLQVLKLGKDNNLAGYNIIKYNPGYASTIFQQRNNWLGFLYSNASERSGKV